MRPKARQGREKRGGDGGCFRPASGRFRPVQAASGSFEGACAPYPQVRTAARRHRCTAALAITAGTAQTAVRERAPFSAGSAARCGLSRRVRRLLHRALDLSLLAEPAPREGRRRTLPAPDRRPPLRALRHARTPSGLLGHSPRAGDVWRLGRRRHGHAGALGSAHCAALSSLTTRRGGTAPPCWSRPAARRTPPRPSLDPPRDDPSRSRTAAAAAGWPAALSGWCCTARPR
jgi:hypothetical protein